MKKMILKSMISMTALALLSFAPPPASAQQTAASAPNSGQPLNERLEGVWASNVTLTDCHGHTIAAFRAFNMFHRGGTITDVDNAPPGMHGAGLGTWDYLGGQQYSSLFYFFNFNPDGTFKGVRKIQRQIVLGGHFGNDFTSTITFESFDPNGNLVVSGCGTESATRLP